MIFLKSPYCKNKPQKSEKLKKIKLSLILHMTPQLHTEVKHSLCCPRLPAGDAHCSAEPCLSATVKWQPWRYAAIPTRQRRKRFPHKHCCVFHFNSTVPTAFLVTHHSSTCSVFPVALAWNDTMKKALLHERYSAITLLCRTAIPHAGHHPLWAVRARFQPTSLLRVQMW